MSQGCRLSRMDWQEFKNLDLISKGDVITEDGRALHALIAQQFSRKQLEDLCELATKIRRLSKTEAGAAALKRTLADKRAMLYFAQPSTRTYLSFLAACQTLGMDTMDVRDTTTSSELKGESQEDSARTFSSYADLIVMRHPKGGFAEKIAWVLSTSARPVPVINAGSGKDQHPTQALLDIYTLERSFKKIGGIDGKTVMFVGDLKRGRTVRSLAWLLSQYNDVRALFVAPAEFQIEPDILQLLDKAGMKYELLHDFEQAIPEADAIYMTRIQDEHDENKGDSARVDISRYKFGVQHLELLKETAILMHPLPRRDEIAEEVDTDPRAMYWRQVRNGMWIRAALMLTVFGRTGRVDEIKLEG